MKAVRLHAKGDLRVEEIAAPSAPQGDQVLVKVSAAGICGSDLHNFRTGQWISRAPSTAGHEFSGTVLSVGPDVRAFKPGDRVAADSRYWCGDCGPCREGLHHLCAKLGFVGELCDGGFAEQVILPERLLHAVPPGLPDEVAAMAEPYAVALHAVRRLQLHDNEPVLIAGAGPIGGLAALVLAEQGFTDIRVADRNAARAQLVSGVTGARVVPLAKEEGQRPLRAAIDATGSVQALRALIDCLDGGARLAIVGISHGSLDIDPNILVEREMSLIGCHAFRDELPDALAMLSASAPRAARLIDRVIGLDDVPEAYRRLIAGEATGLKTIIRP